MRSVLFVTRQVVLEQSLYLTLAMYAVTCLLATAACLFLPIETKGREMQVSYCYAFLIDNVLSECCE